MPLLIVGLLLAVLKYAEIGPFAKISWLWVVLPFVLVVIWWEVVVPLMGLDKKKEHEEFEREKKKRMEANRSGKSKM